MKVLVQGRERKGLKQKKIEIQEVNFIDILDEGGTIFSLEKSKP